MIITERDRLWYLTSSTGDRVFGVFTTRRQAQERLKELWSAAMRTGSGVCTIAEYELWWCCEYGHLTAPADADPSKGCIRWQPPDMKVQCRARVVSLDAYPTVISWLVLGGGGGGVRLERDVLEMLHTLGAFGDTP